MTTVQLIAHPPFAVDYHAIQAEQDAHPKELSERIKEVASNAFFLLKYVLCCSVFFSFCISLMICVIGLFLTTMALSQLFLTAFLIMFVVLSVVLFSNTIEGVYPFTHADPRLNTSHIKTEEIHVDVSHVPEAIQIGTLVEFFDETDFENPTSSHYMSQAALQGHLRLTVREKLTSLAQVKWFKFNQTTEDMARFCIHKVAQDYDNFMSARSGVIPDKADQNNYQKYRDLFEAKSRLALDVAIASFVCSAQMATQITETYLRLSGANWGTHGSLKDRLEQILAEARFRVAQIHVHYLGLFKEGQAETEKYDVHTYTVLMTLLGRLLALPHTEHFSDFVAAVKLGEALRRFFVPDPEHPEREAYTPDLIRKEIQDKLKAGLVLQQKLKQGELQSSPEIEGEIATSTQLRESIFDWLKTQVGEWRQPETQAAFSVIATEISQLSPPSGLELFHQIEILRDLMFRSDSLPSLEEWESFVTELSSTPAAKAFLSERLGSQYIQARHAWKAALVQPALATPLKTWAATFSQTSIETLRPLCQSIAWGEAVNQILQQQGCLSISLETLVHCHQGQAELAQVLKDHMHRQRGIEFMREILRVDEGEDPALSVAKNGLKPEVLEWLLVKQGILNPPQAYAND